MADGTGYRDDEEGSVMLLALVVMLVLTLVGLGATRSSVFEIKMAGNQRTLDEEFTRAETAVNLAVRNFRKPEDETKETDMAALLNDTDNPGNQTVSCVETRSLDGVALARVEIRRIFIPESGETGVVPGLLPQSNAVPVLSHRYYDGSVDRKRFAVTATAMKRGSVEPSHTWVQKGVALPSEQDRDLF
ncbi:PilX N-terminal domain-containing pilus assembly protein [Desulfoluna sp.]|uniref:PilX N-terminal domain-containing pilus assembly protein n=1 Tax=Desulfoluna sp. TaxID=2045199 RepID=UPI0026067507|nr:PilX N-terminal domain-containing pilus assembly protein [Desulfoluna sp.]